MALEYTNDNLFIWLSKTLADHNFFGYWRTYIIINVIAVLLMVVYVPRISWFWADWLALKLNKAKPTKTYRAYDYILAPLLCICMMPMVIGVRHIFDNFERIVRIQKDLGRSEIDLIFGGILLVAFLVLPFVGVAATFIKGENADNRSMSLSNHILNFYKDTRDTILGTLFVACAIGLITYLGNFFY